jgi:hypothetical protein
VKPAPPLYCDSCNRRIGKRRVHILLADLRVLCAGCVRPGMLAHGWFAVTTRADAARRIGAQR